MTDLERINKLIFRRTLHKGQYASNQRLYCFSIDRVCQARSGRARGRVR